MPFTNFTNVANVNTPKINQNVLIANVPKQTRKEKKTIKKKKIFTKKKFMSCISYAYTVTADSFILSLL